MAVPPGADAPLIILANFMSPVALDLREHTTLSRWAEQAPRELFLARPGDALVSPVVLSEPFTAYVHTLLGLPHGSVDIITVRDEPGWSTADTVHRSPLAERLRSHVMRYPGARLLPIALDAPTLALADAIGAAVSPLGRAGPAIGAEALAVVSDYNTKAGFRAAAADVGMRLPPGRVCSGGDLPGTVGRMLARYPRVVVKPDRSAGGYGLRFVTRDDPAAGAEDSRGCWIVEEHVPHSAAVSAQFLATFEGPRLVFDGRMDTLGGTFTGYRSPLPGDERTGVRDELNRWGLALGDLLMAQGYVGPYGIDALLGEDGRLYATESNVRRTATTTPHALVGRLTSGNGRTGPNPAWLMATTMPAVPLTFPQALARLRHASLAYEAERGDGAVLHTDRPADGGAWRYLVIATGQERLSELATAVDATLR
ncbi:peptide ligase PGM1-related protein [Streptomyces scopuliridis]|uniref:Peptide ligase PGM1-related protein n=1 Tax=Streptomyces scopuliridis TaxID=452529 RepID=A0ACD4ZIF5_9ACTN|nr:peptide ligase PGM1-related protein [Streptomyces scopuliridis]WSB98159.1 peptide ligase PGM1-related protein [Streptomyces scopuliridis]WSC08139.1 peptide ligase PGM1-related protein [Streptomyces scopuliridis]